MKELRERSVDEETRKQLEKQYDTSIQDIRLFKDTQWKIATICYALFGAIILNIEKFGTYKGTVYSLVITIALGGIIGIYRTNKSLNSARDVVRNIQGEYTQRAKEVIGLTNVTNISELERIFFPFIFYAAIVLAGVVTLLVVYNQDK